MALFQRRKPPGKQGGRHVTRDFYFVKPQGNLYPSESEALRMDREPDDPNRQPSWSWALSHLEHNDLWLVVPIDQTLDVRVETNKVRASLWRTANRRGVSITSQYVEPNLYIKTYA